jgi:hypothetical protein
MRHRYSTQSTLFRLAMLLVMLAGFFPAAAQPAAAAAPVKEAALQAQPEAVRALTNTVALKVVSARTEPYWRENPGTPISETVGIQKGDPISVYNYIINEDNTGNPFPNIDPVTGVDPCHPYLDPPANTIVNTAYPDSCNYPGVRAVPSNSPIVTQGDQTWLSETQTLALDSGSYLVSVSSEDFKVSGQWFTLPMEEDTPGSGVATVLVEMQPYPLPVATIRVKVFNDNTPTNWGPDMPAEDGLEGFVGHVADWAGAVTNDMFGNPLCTEYYTATNTLHGYLYDADGAPVPVEGSGGICLSDANGDLVIPNMGTNRFEVWVVPPDGTTWTQTTTLEGNKPFDTWVMEGSTGFDYEFVTAGEPFPVTIFGFVQPTDFLTDTNQTGEINGVIAAAEVYIPFAGGLPYLGSLWGGFAGSKTSYMINQPWVALADLQAGDTAVWVGRGNADGTFSINNVPDGDYFLSWWDDANLYLLDWMQVSVRNGEVVDLGLLFLTGWFTGVSGRVFIDENENGVFDEGEHGINDYPILMRRRENSEMDRGAILVTTLPGGYYEMENVYPINQWIIMEAYLDTYYTTGVTFQAFNQAEETTILGAGVDVGLMPVIGQSARVDWGVKPYDAGTNGGIAGTVFYETTRNELEGYLQAVEPWSVGIPDLTLDLYAPVPCGVGDTCDASGKYKLAADGSFEKGAWLNSTATESWERPVDCTARTVDGDPLVGPTILPPYTGGYDCLEPILMGTQVQNGFASVDGNFAFAERYLPSFDDPSAISETLPVGDYLVEVTVPTDPITGEPVYQVVREEDVNVFGGASWVPQIPPSPCAGALHTVDVADILPDGPDAVYNPSFVGEGGSPYEGQEKHLCDMKLITVSDGRSIAPAFNFFTKVPLPGRHWGLILDDLTISVDPFEMTYGEKAGIPNAPVGIYDFTNKLVKVTHSDPHGYFQALLPSTENVNSPSPSGVSANMYFYVGNDPGQPGALNTYYTPQYRTIAAPFELYPGIGIVADLAPTQIGIQIQAPGAQGTHPASCKLEDTQPEFFAADKAHANNVGSLTERTVTINGKGFGATRGTGRVRMDTITMPIVSWSDTQIVFRVPFNLTAKTYQLEIRASNNKTTINALTFHLTGANYNPTVFEVGPGKPYATIQSALEAAVPVAQALVVVYPGETALWNPYGVYYENLIIHSPVKLQGVGPGGVYADGTQVAGSVVSGIGFAGDGTIAAAWEALIASLTWVGNQFVYEGAVMTVFAESNNQFTEAFKASIDGFTIEGGNQQGFPANINLIGGTQNGATPNAVMQGGGIFVNGYARYLQIKNNKLQSNGGAYGGAIRLGTPNLPTGDPTKDAQNDNIVISRNLIFANGGTNLAGGIGVFDGAQNYEISYNDICGNYSAEYGGGISHYGYSPNSDIFNNRIYFNQSYDEGGGIMISGELPADPVTTLSPGSGRVYVYNNIIQGNLANDDGGGLRFLMAGNFPFRVYNNMIVNNVSTHEGAGVSLNDAPDVRFYNNTVMKNLTTATALTSTGAPAPAGLSTSRNTDLMQATLPIGSPIFSEPLMFNNIFWDNRSGSWDGLGIHGLGLPGDTAPINYWDMGLSDLTFSLHPVYSIYSSTLGTAFDPTNLVGEVIGAAADPNVRSTYDTSVVILPWRGNPRFVGINLVAIDVPPTLMGDYHLTALTVDSSPAIDAGTTSYDGVAAPARDIDGDRRIFVPGVQGYEIGADERGILSGYLLALPGEGEQSLLSELWLPFVVVK